MGNACKFSGSKPVKEAIIDTDEKPISSNQRLIDKEKPSFDNNPQLLEISSPQKNNPNLPISEAKTGSEKTNESLPQGGNMEFEDAAPKQFVEVQINHLNKEDSLKNEDPGNNNDVFLIFE